MKYLTAAILRSIENMKKRWPDYSMEDIICDMSAAHRVPWKPLLEEYEEWQKSQKESSQESPSGC